jgi:WhiB family transcriptional regulator, redox-sensing transcriptional regulator
MAALHSSLPRAASPAPTSTRAGSWEDWAACRLEPDPDAWFADSREKERIDHALAVCAGCQVRAECLDFAMDRGERLGIWGGLTEEQRARLPDASRRRSGARPSRDLPPMELARRLDGLRAEHGSIRAAARAAGMSRTRVASHLDLLHLDEETQARVNAGDLPVETAAEAVRSQRRAS